MSICTAIFNVHACDLVLKIQLSNSKFSCQIRDFDAGVDAYINSKRDISTVKADRLLK